MNSFISHYDIHVYFEKDTETEQEALRLHQRIQEVFPGMRVFSPCRDPVGPHPVGMWEGHIYDEASFSKIVPWLCFHHGNLDVLIHPNAVNRGEGRIDHTTRALWLGTPRPLKLSIFGSH